MQLIIQKILLLVVASSAFAQQASTELEISQSFFLQVDSEKSYIIDKPAILTANVVIPEKATLIFKDKGTLNLNGYSLRIMGYLTAPPTRIFKDSRAGGRVEGLIKNNYVLPQWWGSNENDAISDLEGLQSAINTLRPVYLKQGNYRIYSEDLVLPSDSQMFGEGSDKSVIHLTQAQIRTPKDSSGKFVATKNINLKNLQVKKNGNASDWDLGKYIFLIISEYPDQATNIVFENLKIIGGPDEELFRNGGIIFSNVNGSRISGSKFENLFECAIFFRLSCRNFEIKENLFTEIYSNDGAVFIDGHHFGDQVTLGQGSSRITVENNIFANKLNEDFINLSKVKNPAIGIDNESFSNIIRSNTIKGYTGGIYLNSGSQKNLIVKNTVVNAPYFGLLVSKSLSTNVLTAENTFESNRFINCGFLPIPESWNIFNISGSIISVSGGLTSSVFLNNEVDNSTAMRSSENAIVLIFGEKNIFKSNRIRGFNKAVIAMASSNNSFSENVIEINSTTRIIHLNQYRGYDSSQNIFYNNKFLRTQSSSRSEADSIEKFETTGNSHPLFKRL